MTDTGSEGSGTVEKPGTEECGAAVARHLIRLGLLMAAAALLLGWLAAHTDVLFADGLRYISQARAYAHGPGVGGMKNAVDHPVYPLAVAAARHARGGDRPEDWQAAAQLVSIVAGVLLVIPVYLISRELFGDACAVPACVLFYLVPLTGHVFADALSESTFLLFWAWGLLSALKFLKGGAVGWVPAVVAASALAYLTRPEGLLLPAAVLSAVVLSPVWVARGLGKRGMIALAVLVAGSVALVGPYVAMRGGIGTKPSIARLLGTAPKSAAHAVERQTPLDPDQPEVVTYLLAGRAVFKAVKEAVTWPLLPLSGLGVVLFVVSSRGGAVRQARLLGVIGLASVLALLRLHATGGYCSPRHAMIVSLVAIPAAAAGMSWLLAEAARVSFPLSRVGRSRLRAVSWSGVVVLIAVMNGPETLAPVNQGLDGYRQAGQWLAGHSAEGSKVVDVTGWSQFYGRREGYTFENLVAAPADPSARWVVAREAHLKGPWEYCERLRALVDGLEPVEVFRGAVGRHPTRIYLFDRQPRTAGPNGPGAVRR